MAAATIAWGEPGVFSVGEDGEAFGMQIQLLASSTATGRVVHSALIGLPVEPCAGQFRITENEPTLWALSNTEPEALEPFAEAVVEAFKPRIQAALQRQ